MSVLQVNSIKDASDTKTLATLSSSAVTMHGDVTVPASIGGTEVLLNTYTANNSSDTIQSEDFSTTYTQYKIVITSLLYANNNQRFMLFMRKSDGTVRANSNQYRTVSMTAYYSGSSSNHFVETATDTLIHAPAHVASLSQNGNANLGAVIHIFDPASSSIQTHAQGSLSYIGDGGYVYINDCSGRSVNGAEAHNSFQIKSNSGNITTGTVRVYGIK